MEELDREGIARMAEVEIAKTLIEANDVFVRAREAGKAVAHAITALYREYEEFGELGELASSLLYELTEGGLLPLFNISQGECAPEDLMLLIPRLLLSRVGRGTIQHLLDKVEDLVHIYNMGIIDYNQLKTSTALLLFETLASEFEDYGTSPLEWYHGMLLKEYNSVVDEEREELNATYYRIGDMWLKKSTKWTIRKGLAREVIYYAHESPQN